MCKMLWMAVEAFGKACAQLARFTQATMASYGALRISAQVIRTSTRVLLSVFPALLPLEIWRFSTESTAPIIIRAK